MTTKCDLCGREIPKQEAPALCTTCIATCKAHVRVDRNYAEYVRCSPDEQLDRHNG
ncbi:hypothetical protein LCGC14_1770010 [marine sediment metagenome]|uniref:Uncharacterized protein n=1 Tax=marine sediment metagenome TaxID=412755 RepID=A0A0F9JDI2_9ZZZZ